MTFEELKLYANKPGTYRITAIFDGNDEYSAKETTFILIIDEDPEVAPTIIPLPTGGDPEPVELSFENDTVEYVIDIDTNKYDLQLPNNPKNLALLWSCSDNNVSFDIQNGKIMLPSYGEYVITVTFSGDDEYQATSASYTICITDENGNTVVDKPSYLLYFSDSLIVNDVNNNDTYYFQSPLTRRTNDNIVPQDILDLCYYTIGDDTTHITDESFVIDDIGTYTIYLHFTGNEDWLPQTISYILNIREFDSPNLKDPKLSFSQQTMTFNQSNVNNTYILQPLNNEYNVSPIRWSVTSYNSDNIVLQPSSNICIVTKPGTYTINAMFNGNYTYKASSASYNLIVSAVNQEDAQIYYERLSDKIRISEPIGNGYTVAMPKLINPFQLPYTISVSTNDIMVEQTGGEYDRITFFTPVKNAVVTASFAGDDTYDPMTATYTVTLVALANRDTPRLEFQYPIVQPEVNESGINGLYTLQRVYSPDIPKSRLSWSVSADDAVYGVNFRMTTDEDNEDHQLITDGVWREWTITVSFAGDDDWMSATATYQLIPQREEEQLELRVEHDILYLYSFGEDDIYTYRVDPQPCYLYRNGEYIGEVGVEYVLEERFGEPTSTIITARGMIYDEDNNQFVITRTGRVYITARFVGNDVYGPAETTYIYDVTDEDDPNIIKKQVYMSYDPSIAYVEYVGIPNLYYIPRPILYVEDPDPEWPSLDDLELQYSVIKYTSIPEFREDVGAIMQGSTLACDGIGVCKIRAEFKGNRYYLKSHADYTLLIYDPYTAPVDIDLLFGPDGGIDSYNSAIGTYRYARAAWKLHSEPEGNYYQNWKYDGLEITYSCSDPDAIIEFGDDTYDGTITLPNGEGYYIVTATFAGNQLFNPATASYVIKVGDVQLVEKDSLLSFNDVVYNVNENWPDNLYAFQTLNNPNNIPSEELHWSIAEADGTPAFTQAIEIRDGQIYVYDIRYDVVVTVTYDGNTDQFPHNTNIVYAPKTISYTMHVVPETIVKRDVTISFTEPTINWLYADYYHVEISPQTPTLSEEMPIVWSINNGGQMRGEQITENRPTGNVVIETRNPRIYLDSVGTYTVTASFAGDRYRNPATASYTIEFAYNYASVYFENEIVTVELDTESAHYYYPIQAVTKPNDIEVVYYLYLGGNNKIQIDQAQGCDLIASAGDWEIRAYYTEYGVEKYVSYTLRVVDDISQQEETGTVSFDQSEIVLPYSPTNRYNIQKPTCTGVYTLIKTRISGSGASTQELSGYSTMDVELDDGLSYHVSLTYKVGGDENTHTISYTLIILSEHNGITFNPRLTYDKLIWNMSKTISNRYTIKVDINAENVCGYGTNKNQIGEYDRYSLTKQFDTITLDNNNPDLDLPIYNYDYSLTDLGTGSSSHTYAWQRFTKASINLRILKNNIVVDTFDFVVERTPYIANYGYDTIIFRPTRYHYSNPIPKLTIDNSYHSAQIKFNNKGNIANLSLPRYISPVDEIIIGTWRPELSAPDTIDANVTIYKPNNEQYLVNKYKSFTSNLTVNFVGEQEPEPYVGMTFINVTENPDYVNQGQFTLYAQEPYKYYTSEPNSNVQPLTMIENPDYNSSYDDYDWATSGSGIYTARYMTQPIHCGTYIYLHENDIPSDNNWKFKRVMVGSTQFTTVNYVDNTSLSSSITIY